MEGWRSGYDVVGRLRHCWASGLRRRCTREGDEWVEIKSDVDVKRTTRVVEGKARQANSGLLQRVS